jgi:N-acetylneuraminic acid mutarotase
MWYAGGTDPDDHIYDIGYAISTDGNDWEKYTGNPVMKKGPGGSWDNRSVFAPNVIDSAGVKYKMWYNGRPPGSSWGVKFGYAETYEPAWMELTPMDIRLGQAISASIDSVIYVFGGSDAQLNEVSSARAFDTRANSWSLLADIPYKVSYGHAEAINGKVYVLGGWYTFNGEPVTRASTLEYDPSGDSYLEKAPSPEPNGTAATCILEDTIYIFGGTSTPTPQNQNKAWYYVPDTDSWGALPDMIHGRPGGASAEIIDRKIYVMGGTEETGWSNPTKKVEVYDPTLGTWSELADMPVSAVYPASTVYDNKILLFGGDSSVNIVQGHYNSIGTDLVQSYDPASDTWTIMKGMPFTRTGMASERVDNYLYFIGGFPNGRDLTEALDEVWRFNLDSLEEWVVPCSEVLISQESLTLKVDSTYVLTACALPTYAVDRTISWSSSDEGIARVSNEGEVIAVSMGEASITATAIGGGCTASCSVSVSPGVGLTNWKAIQISVLPNPVTDILVIKTSLQDGHTVEITSLNGQVIYRRTMDQPTNEIDLSSFKKGVYFINIRSKDFITTRKIIKL